jgi:hypothetical protein
LAPAPNAVVAPVGEPPRQLVGFVDEAAARDTEVVLETILDGAEPPSKRLFSIPVLSLMPLPLLEVKDVAFDFGVRLIAAFELPTERGVRAWPPPEPTEDPPDTRWRAMLAMGRSAVGDQTDALARHEALGQTDRAILGLDQQFHGCWRLDERQPVLFDPRRAFCPAHARAEHLRIFGPERPHRGSANVARHGFSR